MTLQLPVPSRAVRGRPASGTLYVVNEWVALLRTGIANLVFLGREDSPSGQWLLVDCGITGHAHSILTAAEQRFGKGSVPQAIVLTHGHFDHVGSLEALLDQRDVPVLAHSDEHPFLTGRSSYPAADPMAGGGLMTLLSPLFPRGPLDISHRLAALSPDGSVADIRDWKWIHTPGHTPGHVSLWNAKRKILISGDACITTGQESVYEAIVQEPELHGPPRYFTPDWDSACRSVELLASLPVSTLVTGHGPPLHGEDVAPLMSQLAANFDQIARPSKSR
jgi:glyoxylase-like metal-dependent hydrolase (beta-lactamase superfamily II)